MRKILNVIMYVKNLYVHTTFAFSRIPHSQYSSGILFIFELYNGIWIMYCIAICLLMDVFCIVVLDTLRIQDKYLKKIKNNIYVMTRNAGDVV